jgi:2-isopropylmalate synthase
MSVEQKQALFDELVALGFKEIEVGFPAASQPDFDFVRKLIDENRIPDDVTVQVLVQAREHLIAKTFEALSGVKQAIVHVYNSTSPVQRKHVFGLDKAGIVDVAVQGARWVKHYADQSPDSIWRFENSPESFSATEPEFALEVCNAVLSVWQPLSTRPAIINLPSTVEMTSPNLFADQIEYMCRGLMFRDAVVVSVHTHNDRGCAVAAAELALMAGADRVEGTLFGNGERTGNMDVVTMAMNMYSRGVDPCLDLSDIQRVADVVTECTDIELHPRHPYVGEFVYAAFSGSHQDAIRKCLSVQSAENKWDVAYLPIDPADLGRSYQKVIQINSQSGKGGVAYILEQHYGFTLPKWMQLDVSQKVQSLSELEGGCMAPESIVELFEREFVASPDGYICERYEKQAGHDGVVVELSTKASSISVEGRASGVMSSVVEALKIDLGVELDVSRYQEQALSKGARSLAVAFCQVNIADQMLSALAFDSDIVQASINALLSTVNRYVAGQ